MTRQNELKWVSTLALIFTLGLLIFLGNAQAAGRSKGKRPLANTSRTCARELSSIASEGDSTASERVMWDVPADSDPVGGRSVRDPDGEVDRDPGTSGESDFDPSARWLSF